MLVRRLLACDVGVRGGTSCGSRDGYTQVVLNFDAIRINFMTALVSKHFALLLALIAVICIVAVSLIGHNASTVLSTAARSL